MVILYIPLPIVLHPLSEGYGEFLDGRSDGKAMVYPKASLEP